MKWAKGAMKHFKKVKVKIHKPYVRPIFKGQNPQMTFPGRDFENKAYFDLNFTIPRPQADKIKQHFKKNRWKYELAGSTGGAYVGAKLAQRSGRKKK